MKVLYVTPSLGAGGAERQASLLLPGLRRRGVDARALALDSGGPFVEPLRAARVPVEVAHMRHRLHLAPLLRSTLVTKFAPDVIVSRGVSGLYVGHVLARWRGATHVYNDHRGVGVELSRRRAAMIRLLVRRLSGVIVVSPDQCEGWLDSGCPRERVAIIPNGVSLSDGLGAREEVRRELGLPEDSVVAMMVASLRPVKRVPDYVRGVLRAREHCPELIGMIVGDGTERDAVRAAAGGDPGIRLLGHRDDVSRILEAADMLVLTSEHEAMPMAILEGMAAGLPVLATRVGGIPKMVSDGETGLLVPPADPDALANGLVRLASDHDLRRAMGRAGRERCHERWDAEAMIDSYLEVLTQARAATHPAALPRPARRPQPLRGAAGRFVRHLDRRGWVTWERSDEEADVLTVTNYWPDADGPTRAPFLRFTVQGLLAAGVKTDVVYVRGYKGKHVYALACAAMAALPLARPRKYRLVHSHAGETALAARFFWGAPVLATYWGTDLIGSSLGSPSRRLRFRLASRLLRLHAALMTATTTKTTEMERLLPPPVRRRNWVIPDGVDVSRFRPSDRLAARAALGWAADARIVINVGDRSPVKRVWLAEQAAEQAAHDIDGLRFYAVSDAPPEDMPLYYNAADVLLHTAASEGSPNAVKEAVACNLPVLATPAGDIAQLLDGVEPSVICEAQPESLARELARLLREPRRSNGHERIAPLQLEATTARTLACYRSLGVPIPGGG